MRPDMRILGTLLALLTMFLAAGAGAQSAADGPILGARPARSTTGFKMYCPAGSIRLVAWDRDSVLVRGRVSGTESFFMGGGLNGMKLGMEDHWSSGTAGKSRLVVYFPRGAKVSVKTITASIDGVDVSGWFYSVSGAVHLSGAASSVVVESMNGNLD